MKDMIKINSQSLILVATSLLFFASTNMAIAAQCSVVFPDGASTHSNSGNIAFGSNAELIGSDDNLLATTTLTRNSGSSVSTCNTADCVATGMPSAAASDVNFQTSNANDDVSVSYNETVVVGSGNNPGNEFDRINDGGSSEASITFSDAYSEYIVDRLTLGYDNVLYLQAGSTYWFNRFTMGSQSEIIVLGSGTALVYVNHSLSFPSPSLINSPSINSSGDASQLVMYVFDDVTFTNDSTYTGSLYAQGNVSLGSSSYVFGAISAADITLGTQSTITYQNDEIAGTNFGDMCDAPPPDPSLSCSTYFPDSIQGHTADSELIFDHSGQIIGDSDATLTFPSLDGNGGSTNTCDTTDCSITGTYAPALTLPTFVTSSSNTDIEPNNSTITIGPSGTFSTTQIDELIVNGNDDVTFLASASEYIIDDALFDGGTVTFNAGTYWFDELEIIGDSIVIINGAVTFFINGQDKHFDIEDDAQVNVGGAAQNLAIVSYQQIHLKDNSRVNAVLYGIGSEIKLEDDAQHTGAISSAEEVEIKDDATSTYADVSGVQIGNLCGVSQNVEPIIDFRFDELNWSGSPNEVIDSSGNTNNGTAIGGVTTALGKICNAANIPDNNSASTFEAVDSGVDLDAIIGSSGTISLWYRGNSAWNSGTDRRLFDATDGDKYFLAEIASDGRIKFFFEDGNDGDYQKTTVNAFAVNAGDWKHLTFVWDVTSITAKIFVDGVEQDINSGSNTDGGTTPFAGFTTLYFGDNRSASYFQGQSSAGGLIDEALVFDSALTSTQIQTIFTNQDNGNNYDGSARNCPIEALAGRVTLNNTADSPAFTSVCFDTPFSEVPRVFSLPTTASDSDRLALRIRNVTETGFEIAQVESQEDANPSAPAGNVSQIIDFLAILEGDYTLDGGGNMRVNSINTQAFVGGQVSGDYWETISTADLAFSESPAIIASIQTMNNETNPFPSSSPFLATSIANVNNTQFQIALERAETDSGTLNVNENIAYIAINPGATGQLTTGVSYESFQTNDAITGVDTCDIFNLNGDYSTDAPLVIASQNTRDGGDGGWLKRCSISASSVGFSIVEDNDNDTDTNHTSEQAGGIALGGTFTNQTCTAQPSYVHHYEIVHDGQGLTCDAEVVTVNACANASCSTLSTQPVTLDFLVDATVISSPTFTGSTTVNVNNTDVETVSFSLANTSITASSPVECDDSSGISCEMDFTDAGFRFLFGAANETTLPNQTSGSVFSDTLKLQAVQNDNGVCTGLFNGDQDVDLSQENVEPGGTSGLSFTVDGATIAKHSSVTSTTLNFGAQSIAIIPTPIYNDAGQIRLRASYNQANVTILSGSSNPFWVSPAELAVSASFGGTALNAATANAALTHEAGGDFDLSVTALNSLGVVTPNYSPGQIQLMLTRTGPTLTGSVDGILSYGGGSTIAASNTPAFQNATLTTFSSGVSAYNAAQYSEVGLLNLDVRDNNYGSSSMLISATPINIGRFIPGYFTQTVADDGLFAATCDSTTTFSAYSGQMDEATNSIGAISYLTNPVLAITAHNRQGNITQNYFEDSQGGINDYMKLSASDINLAVPTVDQSAAGVDSNQLPLTANMSNGILSQTNLTASSSGAALPRGTLHYQLSDADHFFYNRSANALVAPFTSDIDFSIATIIDADNVSVTTTVDASPTGVEIRFGRLLLKNSFGPETSNFPQLMEIEHFDGNVFVATPDENCARYDAGRISLTNISLNPSHTSVLGGTGVFIYGQTQTIELQAPGAGNQGQIGVLYDAYDWFNYDWDNDGAYDDSPGAVATFGLYRGNDRTIHWREVFND